MVSNERQSAQTASTLAWLEDTMREQKAQIGRLTQQAEESQSEIWELNQRLLKTEELAGSIIGQLDAIPHLESEVQATNGRFNRTEDRQAAVEVRVAGVARNHQIDTDYIRTETNELVKRVEAWERLTQGWTSRMDTNEEIGRRAYEATSIVRQRVEDFERFVELVDQRGSRTAEALKRVDNEFTRLNLHIEALQKHDAIVTERIQVYAEIVKRLDQELSTLSQQLDFRREVNEKLELQRAGLRRGEERLSVLEATDAQVRDEIDGLQRAIALVETKDRGLRDRLAGLQEQLGQHYADISTQFQKIQAISESQKRRLIEDLERDIRELKVNAYRPAEH